MTAMSLFYSKNNTNNKNKFRYEKKYLLDINSAVILRQRVSHVLEPDNSAPFGKYRVSSLYFDDIYSSSYNEKLNGVLTRDKYRARYYNGSFDTIRLERKHKHGENIYKESALITPSQYQMMCRGEYDFMRAESLPVFNDFYTAFVLKHMHPVIMIEYNRQAFMHKVGNVRLTFDTDLTAGAPMASNIFSILPHEYVVLEVKYDHFLPSYINGLLTGVPFTQQLPISKFILGKQALNAKCVVLPKIKE
ncbi:MAG: polyphosphate polymerase domain-containing protein [Oscillospiraceae bacterium]|jgi:SPX domain protein involved in polyphosphate accumulation|nr:polyphosphate polymerase domain-containing protein [Oscillospiraceae bacterium]